ncbi:MAG: DUF4260 domain-containing protein [Acidobacteriales bacterium]|nr:DUF4260 domain-containing protein [Terriglobales bacterium]
MNTTTTLPRTATMLSLPAALLRLEGATFFFGAIALFASQGGSGLMFVLLLFAPDLAMIGYLANPRVGSYTYNAVHTYALPAILAALALVGQWPLGVHFALIWFAHIGMDRMMGYGLKYPTAFKDTHLQRI